MLAQVCCLFISIPMRARLMCAVPDPNSDLPHCERQLFPVAAVSGLSSSFASDHGAVSVEAAEYYVWWV